MPYRRRSARRRYGTAAGATLGYIAGNLPGAFMGAMAARKYFRGRRNNRRGGGGGTGSSGRGVTTQHDTQTVYRKRSMPKRKRRSWKKFIKKVQAAADDRGTMSFVMNGQHAQITPNAVGGSNRQVVMAVHLYGKNSVSTDIEPGKSDLKMIAAEISAMPIDAQKSTTTTNVQFKSAVLDVTLQNQIAADGYYQGPMEVDIYHLVYPKKLTTTMATLGTAFTQAAFDTSQTGTLPKIGITDRGVTPFAMGPAGTIAGYKILSKKKYFMAYGQTATYQIRDPKNRYTNLRKMQDDNSFCMHGWTQSLLIIGKPQGPIGENQNFDLIAGVTRSYNVSYEGINADSSHYFNNQL